MKNEFLRHTLATISYRFQRSIVNSSNNFGSFNAGNGVRTPNEIINHLFQVLLFAKHLILKGNFKRSIPEKLKFKLEVDRFLDGIQDLDDLLSENEIDTKISKRIVQGPFADILTHIGQISMLSRLNNKPIKGEDFSIAKIQTGKF
jgi:hypothetical protein